MKQLKTLLARGDMRLAIGAGLLYGVLAQLAVRLDALGMPLAIMSFGYVFVMPVGLGMASAQVAAPRGSWMRSLTAAYTSTALCLAVAFAVGWEGSICLVMAAPVYFVCATVGAILGHLVGRRSTGGTRHFSLAVVLLLPAVSAGIEHRLATRTELRRVANSIDIAASPKTVFAHIARVAPITEPQDSFFFTMGFPRPIEATLSHEAVGGIRHASFERGLLFVETVTEWQPERSLRFSIAVDPDHTPLATLDAHVTVGGVYFDVLQGGYRIEPLGRNRVRLHLDSQHRISTHFNFYTGLWSEYLMSEIQQNILRVIRARCEVS